MMWSQTVSQSTVYDFNYFIPLFSGGTYSYDISFAKVSGFEGNDGKYTAKNVIVNQDGKVKFIIPSLRSLNSCIIKWRNKFLCRYKD